MKIIFVPCKYHRLVITLFCFVLFYFKNVWRTAVESALTGVSSARIVTYKHWSARKSTSDGSRHSVTLIKWRQKHVYVRLFIARVVFRSVRPKNKPQTIELDNLPSSMHKQKYFEINTSQDGILFLNIGYGNCRYGQAFAGLFVTVWNLIARSENFHQLILQGGYIP